MMRDICKIFLLSCFLSGIAVPGFCGTGMTDARFYVDDDKWATEPYKNFVIIRPCVDIVQDGAIYMRSLGRCTAQYIAPNLILSAEHCLDSLAEYYTITRYNDTEKLGVEAIEKVLDFGDEYEKSGDVGDWTIFKIYDATRYHNFYSDSFFDVKVPERTTSVISAGFGWVRVLTDAELDKIRELSQDIKTLDNEKYFDELKSRMESAGMEPLEEEKPKLKASECKIVFENYSNLKRSKNFPNIIGTTCDTWGGNSGGGYISKDGKYLYGVVSYGAAGYYNFTDRDNDYMTSAQQFFDVVQKYKSQYPVSSQVEQAPIKNAVAYTPIKVDPKPGGIPGPNVGDMNATIASIKIPNLIPTNTAGPVLSEPNLISGTVLTGVDASGNAVQWKPGEIPAKTTSGTTDTPQPNFDFELDPTDYENTEEIEDFVPPQATPTTVTINPRQPDVSGSVSSDPNLVSGTVLTGVDASGNAVQWKPGEIPLNTINVEPKTETVLPALNTSGIMNILPGVDKLPQPTFSALGAENARLQLALEEKQEEIDKLRAELANKIPNVSNMSNEELLRFLDGLVTLDVKKRDLEVLKELQQKYEEAKGNEQSKANRLLTAASIAATGIGGMELAQGLAEQKADKAAAQDMTAYIATMRCKYGKDKQVKAGPDEIELPGGNDANMTKLRTEYFTLAKDLKERKTALGMKPGIESEEILDKAQTGLYDQENLGIDSGAYASLYRAQMLGSEKDKTEIDEATQKSKTRVTAGGTAAGAGVVGGVVGDSLINGELSEKIKENKKKTSRK